MTRLAVIVLFPAAAAAYVLASWWLFGKWLDRKS